MTFEKRFNQLAKAASHWTGRPSCFVLAVAAILIWAALGPAFHYSDTWQLVVNTATTIITFLMVFLIQSTQNRDTAAIQVKLDELIRAAKGRPQHGSLSGGPGRSGDRPAAEGLRGAGRAGP